MQACLLASGSLDPHLLDRLGRRKAVAQRYVAFEGPRALAANLEVLPPAARPLAAPDDAIVADGPAGSLRRALGREAAPEVSTVFGAIYPRRVGSAGPPADAAVADPRHLGQGDPGLTPLADDGDRDVDDPREVGNLLSSPVGGGGPIGRLLARLLESARGLGEAGDPGADGPTHAGTGRAGGGREVLAVAPATDDAEGGPGDGGTTYPEWNARERRYRPGWCTVVESDAPSADEPGPGLDGRALRPALSRLGMGLARFRRQLQGDDIDIDVAVDARVSVLAGRAPDENFYIDSLRHRRDLSAMILLDVSGSAAEAGVTGRPVHELQVHAAGTLTAALHDLGDRVGLYAFNSRGRHAVQVMRVKGFDDALDAAVARRLAGLEPGGYTRLGAAIRHATSVVERQGGTSRRLLVVISDGFAYDHGYSGAYGEADARRALAEARHRGVGCVCLSIGAGAEAETLGRVFGTAAHASMRTADHLPRVAAPLFHAALRAAESQRRVFQRTERTRERLEIDRRAS